MSTPLPSTFFQIRYIVLSIGTKGQPSQFLNTYRTLFEGTIPYPAIYREMLELQNKHLFRGELEP